MLAVTVLIDDHTGCLTANLTVSLPDAIMMSECIGGMITPGFIVAIGISAGRMTDATHLARNFWIDCTCTLVPFFAYMCLHEKNTMFSLCIPVDWFTCIAKS